VREIARSSLGYPGPCHPCTGSRWFPVAADKRLSGDSKGAQFPERQTKRIVPQTTRTLIERVWRYYRNMRAGFSGSLLTLFLVTPFCSAQPAYVEVRLPRGVRSETMFVRYVVNDDFGGWVQPRPSISSYFITIHQGASATRFKAILYAPGCAIQTANLPISGSAVPRYSFVCDPLPNITLTGTLTNPARLDGREINIEARYVARWAQGVLGDGMVTDIPLGVTHRAFAGGGFQISVPDLSKDPLAGTPDHPGELRILARDRARGKIVAQLVPTAEFLRERMGGLQIRDEYSEPVEFAFCAVQGRRLLDPHGFAIRSDPSDSGCDH
jgi:hypothetical protein